MRAPPAISGYQEVEADEAIIEPADLRSEPAAELREAGARGRGWLVRRALLAADLVGLIAALFLAQALFTDRSTLLERLTPTSKWLLFLVALPAWVVAAKLYKLYDRDEERTDHSTVDDVVGVFHLVTVAVWVSYRARSRDRPVRARPDEDDRVLGVRDRR